MMLFIAFVAGVAAGYFFYDYITKAVTWARNLGKNG